MHSSSNEKCVSKFFQSKLKKKKKHPKDTFMRSYAEDRRTKGRPWQDPTFQKYKGLILISRSNIKINTLVICKCRLTDLILE